MSDLTPVLAGIVGPENVKAGDEVGAKYTRDQALSAEPQAPAYLVEPAEAAQVAAVLRLAGEHRVPVTARGSGTGLSGACIPVEGGILVSFSKMKTVLEIDAENQVAVVQPGVILDDLDAATKNAGLMYPVFPGSRHGSIGGNVNTNAGGMRAVRYGVTRHHVLGLQAALPTGELIRTGGRITKCSSGYDLTQLIIGSEGTLALVTEATLKLEPRPVNTATVLAPFADLTAVIAAVPKIVASGRSPYLLEYIDNSTMDVIVENTDVRLPDQVPDTADYLVIGLDSPDAHRLDGDVEALGDLIRPLGAADVFVLDGPTAEMLIEARESAFHFAKAAGADDVVDVVVPRTAMPEFLATARKLAGSPDKVVGCGHAGDGNVHLAVFEDDADKRSELLHSMFEVGMRLGGAISGEHGIGREKKKYFLALEDPAKLGLMRRIKQAFDPAGILNPGVLLDAPTAAPSVRP